MWLANYDMDKQRILIIGHAIYTMSGFIRFLVDGPHEVFIVPDGREGLEILRREKVDFVIAEMYIEDVDGIHFVKGISAEKIQIDILLRARSEFPDLGEEIRKTSISVFSIIRDTFLVNVKTLVPSYDLWKTKLESFLNEHYSNPELKFDDLMDHFKISRSYGCELFKKYLGKPFREALREVRIGKAKSLLEETLLPISEIAENSGFRSSSRFREAFKRLYGISPRAYRQKMDGTIS